MNEVWREIPGFPNHEASSLGRIRRVTDGKGRAKANGILRQRLRPSGYAVVSLSATKVFVHRLVCMAFHGPAPFPGAQVSHEDGDQQNNTAANLIWRTPTENNALKKEHGTHMEGSSCPGAKINETQALIIRSAYRLKMATQQELADFYQVNRATVGDIIKRRTWRHVE